MGYRINTQKCLKCGLCVKRCPARAFVVDRQVTENDGLILYTTRIDPAKCTDCGICISYEWWCPANAIVKSRAV
jgi:ferredoxin